jgi:hypothetical protein
MKINVRHTTLNQKKRSLSCMPGNQKAGSILAPLPPYSLVYILLRSTIFGDPKLIDILTIGPPTFQRNLMRIVVATPPTPPDHPRRSKVSKISNLHPLFLHAIGCLGKTRLSSKITIPAQSALQAAEKGYSLDKMPFLWYNINRKRVKPRQVALFISCISR